jgi:hypothetical protein
MGKLMNLKSSQSKSGESHPLFGKSSSWLEEMEGFYAMLKSDERLIARTPEPETCYGRRFWDHEVNRDSVRRHDSDMCYDHKN